MNGENSVLSTLAIASVEYEDEGSFLCVATDSATATSVQKVVLDLIVSGKGKHYI